METSRKIQYADSLPRDVGSPLSGIPRPAPGVAHKVNSSLYECHVMHARFTPRAHRFVYRIFMFALDLDELPALHRRLRLFSFNRPNLFSFREQDFLPTNEPLHNRATSPATQPQSSAGNLKSRVLAHLAAHGAALPADTRVLLVTLPRVFGYLFNPVSFYFCLDRAGQPLAALAEVTNTFKEVKPYVLAPAKRDAAGAFRLRAPKHFYVSPFSDVDVAFDFTLRAPNGRLSIQIDDYVGSDRTLTSTLTGPRRELTDARLAWFCVKYPFVTLRIIGLIHWNALNLWLKNVPWFPKAGRATDQRDLYRPHASLTRSVPPKNLPLSSAASDSA